MDADAWRAFQDKYYRDMAAQVQTENGIVLLRYDDLAAGRDLTAVRGHILSGFVVER